MSNKQLVIKIVDLLESGVGVRIYGAGSTTVTAQDRKFLESWDAGVLERKLQELTAESIAIAAARNPEIQRVNQQRQQDRQDFLHEQEFQKIFSKVLPGNVVVVDNQAARNVIEGWVDEIRDEKLSLEWFTKVIAENPKVLSQLVLKPNLSREYQSHKDHETFSEFVRAYGYSDNQAGFALALSILGPGFNQYQLQQVVASNALRLAPATAEDQQEWKEERIEQENTVLKSDEASPRQKREIAQQRFVTEHRTAAQIQMEYELVLGFERDVIYGQKVSPLPATWNGRVLTSEFIRKCDKEVLKALIHKYGSSQVTARLRGIKRASAVLDRGNGKGPIEVSYEFA